MELKLSLPQLGPVIGHVEKNNARVWIKGNPHQKGVIIFSKHQDFSNANCFDFPLDTTLDHIGTYTLKNLDADQLYFYIAGVIPANTADSLINTSNFDLQYFKRHRKQTVFKTAPEHSTSTSFILGSCRHSGFWNHNRGDRCFNAINKLQKKKALKNDFIIMTGDQVYADVLHYENKKPKTDNFIYEGDFGGNRHYYIAGRAKSSQEQYFKLYRDAWRKKGFSYLLSHTPAYMMMDDHEIINDWSPADFTPEGSDGKHRKELLDWGLTAYKAYQASLAPIAPNTKEELVEQRYYYQFIHGNCDFFVLDIRSKRLGNTKLERENGINQPPTQLGEEQFKKLRTWINQASNKMKFIVSPVPIFPDVNKFEWPALQRDTWSGFQDERLKILDQIYQSGQQNIAFLSGDVHCSFIAELSCNKDPAFKIYNIVSSAFNWVLPGLNRWHLLENQPLASDDIKPSRPDNLPEYRSQIVELESRDLTGDVIVVNNFCHLHVEDINQDHQHIKQITVNYYTEKGKTLSKKGLKGIKILNIGP